MSSRTIDLPPSTTTAVAQPRKVLAVLSLDEHRDVL